MTRSELRELIESLSRTIAPNSDATPRDRLSACSKLLQYGLAARVAPALQRLVAEPSVARAARQLQLAARQIERLGLVREVVDGSDPLDAVTGVATRLRHPGADTLLLCFGGTANRMFVATTLLDRLLQKLPVNVVYLHDVAESYFMGAIEGLGATYAENLAALDALRRAAGATRLLCLGTCIGGYAALRYGLDLGAEAVLCLSPRLRTRQGDDASDEAAAVRAFGTRINLRDLLTEAKAPPATTILYAERNPLDAAEGQDLDGAPGVVSHPFVGLNTHNIMTPLLAAGTLPALLEGFVRTGRVSEEVLATMRGTPGAPAAAASAGAATVFGIPRARWGATEATVRHRLTHGTLGSLRHRVLYAFVPKAACTTLKTALAACLPQTGETPRDGAPETPSEMRIHHEAGLHGLANIAAYGEDGAQRLLTDPEVLRFSCVRNPFARLHSAWADKIRLGVEPVFRPVIRAIGPDPGGDAPDAGPTGISFARFLDWVCDQPDAERDPHWASQSGLIFPRAIDYHLIARTERLDADVEVLRDHLARIGIPAERFRPGRLNVSETGDWREAYDARLAARVREVFAADFEAFGYDPDDWRPHPGTPPRDLAATLARRERQLFEIGGMLERGEQRVRRAEARLGRGALPADLRPRRAESLAEAVPEVAACLDGVSAAVAEALFDLARADTPGTALAVACALPGVVLPLAAGCLSRRTPRPCSALDLWAPWSAGGTRQRLFGGLASTGLAPQVQVVDLPAPQVLQGFGQQVGILLLHADRWAEIGPAVLAAIAPRLARGAHLGVVGGVAVPEAAAPEGFQPVAAPPGLRLFRRG